MAQAQAVASFTIPAADVSAVPIDFTGLWSDGGSHTPHAYLIQWRNGTAGSTGTGNAFWGRGFSDGTTHWAMAFAASDNVVASEGAGYVTNQAPLVEAALASGALTGLVNHTSFAADTITITPSDALVNSISGQVIAFYDTLGAKVMDETMPAATGSFSKTLVGFQGQSAIFLCGFGSTINQLTGTTIASMGWATSSSAQAMLLARVRDGQTTDYTMGQIATTGVMAIAGTTGTAQSSEIQFTSFDADGYTANRISSTTQYRYGVLVLGSPALALTTAQRTAIETWGITCTGLTPTGVLVMAENPQTAAQTVASEGMHNAVGMATAASQGCVEIHGFANDTLNPNVTEEYTRSENNKLLTHYDRTGADTFSIVGEVSQSAWADELLTLSQDDANATAVFMALLLFGDAFAGGGGSTERQTLARGVARGLSRGMA